MVEPRRPSSPGGGSSGDASRLTASLRAAHRCVSVEIHSGQFSRWGLLPHAPCQPGVSPASALTRVPPPAVHRPASRCSALRFGRNTPGIPPSRALSAGRLVRLRAHVGFTTGCYGFVHARVPGCCLAWPGRQLRGLDAGPIRPCARLLSVPARNPLFRELAGSLRPIARQVRCESRRILIRRPHSTLPLRNRDFRNRLPSSLEHWPRSRKRGQSEDRFRGLARRINHGTRGNPRVRPGVAP